VDYQLRGRMLRDLKKGMKPAEILGESESGMPKLWVAYTALNLRRTHPEWFDDSATYTPLIAEGAESEHFVGFLRARSVAACVPRWSLTLQDNWADSIVNLPPGSWNNLLTSQTLEGGRVEVAALFEHFPVALLTQETKDEDASI